MPAVDTNRLKGNFGAAYVAACLSAECLVRSVTADTDVGVDLYCETIRSSQPFLHFWVQVKSGLQCRVSADGESASCSFSRDHLEYWSRQPVPVFGALVPVDWPVTSDPPIYIVDITSALLMSPLDEAQQSFSLASDYMLPPGNRDIVRQFLDVLVPRTTALLKRKEGVVARTPYLEPQYFKSAPVAPVDGFRGEILDQLRRTASLSLITLRQLPATDTDSDFRRKLARVAAQFDDDNHWETYAARGFAAHVDGEYPLAVEMYERAISIIDADPNTHGRTSWERRKRDLLSDMQAASDGKSLFPV